MPYLRLTQRAGEQHLALPVGATPTLYPMVGSAVGLVAGAGTLAALVWLSMARRRLGPVRQATRSSASAS